MASPAFEVRDLPGRGRGLVAARDLQPGEEVLIDAPLVLTPAPEARSAVCATCLRILGAIALPSCWAGLAHQLEGLPACVHAGFAVGAQSSTIHCARALSRCRGCGVRLSRIQSRQSWTEGTIIMLHDRVHRHHASVCHAGSSCEHCSSCGQAAFCSPACAAEGRARPEVHSQCVCR